MSSFVGCPVKYCDWCDSKEKLDAHILEKHKEFLTEKAYQELLAFINWIAEHYPQQYEEMAKKYMQKEQEAGR